MKIDSNLGKCLILPPEHQMAIEKAAISNNKQLAELLQGRPILGIERTEGGYIVTATEGVRYKANVTYIPNGIGPQKFKLSFEPIPFDLDAATKAGNRRFVTENR